MNELLEQIFKSRQVLDAEGKPRELHAETQREQCLLLQRIVGEVKPMRSLEVGLAYGVSTLAICEKLPVGARHIVCDPYQSDWNDVGLLNVKRGGFESVVDFRRQMAHRVLAELEAAGSSLDFAYLDGGKTVDLVMVNVFYLTRILRVGGVIVMDDCDFPGIRMVCHFMSKLPCYQVVETWGGHPAKVRQPFMSSVVSALPGTTAALRPELVSGHPKLADHPHCIVYKKVSNDDRKWDWHEDF